MKSVPVTLEQVNASNFINCFHLELAPEQEHFVSHPIRSLAQAYVYRDQCTPFAIVHETAIVGYVMVIYDDEEETYNIWHLMVDRRQQGKGYGKAAMNACLDYIRQKPFGESHTVLLTCHKDNFIALRLYEQLGFVPTGNVEEDELELALSLS